MTDEEIRQIFTQAKTIAVVGISDNPERASYRVAEYLLRQGYRIVPVNPNVASVLGLPTVATLGDITEPVDVVDVFRRAEAVPPIVEEAIAIHAGVVWMQEGIVNEEAARQACAAGLAVVMDRCMMKEHKRLMTQ